MYTTSNRFDTWLILSRTTRSRQYHESTMVWRKVPLPPLDFRFVKLFLLEKARQSTTSGVTGACCVRLWLTRGVVWTGSFQGDEPGVQAIGGYVHKRRALNTRLSSGTSAGTFAVSTGPSRNYQTEAGTKNEPDTFFVPLQKKGWKIDPHVSNLRSREFLFRGVQVHP